MRATVRWQTRTRAQTAAEVRFRRLSCRIHASSSPNLAQASQSVIERRAADVLVLGSGPTAYSAAYSLARSGKKVVLLGDFGLELQPSPRPQPQPLVLMDTDQHLVHLAMESAAYWRGLEVMSGAEMLRSCPSIAFGDGSSGSASAEKLERVQAACRGAGVQLSPLATQEVAGRFSSIRLPNGYTTLLQEPGGGLLLPVEVDAALAALCTQAGVTVRDKLLLRGWRDAGGHFVIRSSSRLMPDAMSVFEAEQVLLAPGSLVPSSWSLFQLSSQLSTLQVASTKVAAGSDMQKAPIWHLLGDACLPGATSSSSSSSGGGGSAGPAAEPPSFTRTSDRPMLRSCIGLPSLSAAGRATLVQVSQAGLALDGPAAFQQQPAAAQLQEARHVHHAALLHTRGLAGWQGASCSCQLMCGSEDGFPVVDFHPGFEAGRLVVASSTCSTSSQSGLGHSGYSLSPIVAKAAADLLRGGSIGDVNPAKLSLGRPAVQGSSTGPAGAAPAVDTWDDLLQLQQAPGEQVGEEERQDLASDARADTRESQLSGRQFFGLHGQ